MCYRPHLFPPLLLFTLALSTAAPHPIGAQVEVDVDGSRKLDSAEVKRVWRGIFMVGIWCV